MFMILRLSVCFIIRLFHHSSNHNQLKLVESAQLSRLPATARRFNNKSDLSILLCVVAHRSIAVVPANIPLPGPVYARLCGS